MTEDLVVRFPDRLQQGRILRRPSRFTLDVELDGAVFSCHCPTTGRIGDFVLDGLSCLVSPSDNPARKTAFTVEGVGVPDTRTDGTTWVGINQNAANRYIEAALRAGALYDVLPVREIQREARLGTSRLDFLVNGDTYIEVKTPLQTIQVPTPPSVPRRAAAPFDSTDRLVRHITELANSLGEHQRALLITCFLYNNPGFQITPSNRHSQVATAVSAAVERGVELWQVNLPLTPAGVQWPTTTPLQAP